MTESDSRVPSPSYLAANNLYLDTAATEAADPDVVKAMVPYMLQEFGNPASVHTQGKLAAATLHQAREEVARHLGARTANVIFTSGGTESDNLAIKGIAMGMAARERNMSVSNDSESSPAAQARNEIVISAVEHPAVKESAYWLERNCGFRVLTVPVDAVGRVSLTALKTMVNHRTVLVSVMLANNEVGTIQAIRQISDIAHSCGAVMHTDAVQAAGLIPIDMAALGVDALSISGHKFGTPKGIGVLLLRSSLPYEALISGGGQERGVRSGTQNVAAAVAMAVGLRKSCRHMVSQSRDLANSARALADAVKQSVPNVQLTGDWENRLPGHVSMVFSDVSAEALLVELDVRGISCSSGSACAVGHMEASQTLIAMGFDRVSSKNSLRLTFRHPLTPAQIKWIVEILQASLSALTPKRHHITHE